MELDYSQHIFHSPRFRSIVNEAVAFFEQTSIYKLLSLQRFIGVGVYGLYYMGSYRLYEDLVGTNRDEWESPIYVGKAVPTGWRTARTRDAETPALYSRLREHTRSVQYAENLSASDFLCRFVIFNDLECDLIVPVEAQLIRRYQPLWNTVIDGFGNHDPGKGRYNQAKSAWDVLHPGRPWAERLRGEPPRLSDVIAQVEASRFP